MQSRLDTGPISAWWWTVDRSFLFSFLLLMVLGVVLSFAASPAVAERIGLDSFHFALKQLIFGLPALMIMILISFVRPHQLVFLSFLAFGIFLILMILVLFIGIEVKGARRWMSLGGVSLQPSEFLKPFFVIVSGWLFSLPTVKTYRFISFCSFSLLLLVLALLLAQPDLGQTVLILATWGAMFFISGVSWVWIFFLSLGGALCSAMAYFVFPHVAGRIDRFMTGEGDLYQVNMGMDALIHGGWFGVGPGEGSVKRLIPDSHADFVFAVAGEEFGIALCFIIMFLFAFIVLRGLKVILSEHDSFIRFSVCGLITVFGLQSAINMGVNLHLMPAKGMTLPFISYGGSSLIAIALSMGMVLSLTRRLPEKLRNPRLQSAPWPL